VNQAGYTLGGETVETQRFFKDVMLRWGSFRGLMDVTVGDDSAVANDEIHEPLFYSLQSRG